MARRRTRSTKRRARRARGFNVKQTAFALGTATLAMKATLGVGPWDFFTAGTPLNSMYASGWTQSGDPHHMRITLKEIMEGGQRAGAAGVTPFADAIKTNLANNGMQALMGIVGLKVADKLLGKFGVWRNTNKVLKAAGIKDIVRV